LRNLCREKLESLEHWLRRLIDQTLSAEYGDYFSYTDSAGNRIIKKDIVKELKTRVEGEPGRYSRKIDAVLLSDAIDIICNKQLYEYFFKRALKTAFPDGREEAKTFMSRLLEPRNMLAHANPISLQQAEQVICYSNDIIDSIRAYYAEAGMQKEYNVPLILKVTDSFGNVFFRNQMLENGTGGVFKILRDDSRYFLRPGDILTVEVEVDPAFEPNAYTISWWSTPALHQEISNSPKLAINITARHVAYSFSVHCSIKSEREWHRMSSQKDDDLILYYKVLPP